MVGEKERAPAFQFYARDFLSSSKVMAMTMAERGAYITLLAMEWLDGALPADVEALAAVLKLPPHRFRRLWVHNLARCFESRDGQLINSRLEAERTKQIAFRESCRTRGRKGGQAKAANQQAHTRRTRLGKPSSDLVEASWVASTEAVGDSAPGKRSGKGAGGLAEADLATSKRLAKGSSSSSICNLQSAVHADLSADALISVRGEPHADARVSPARARGGAPLHVSHKRHAACGRICVPAELHGDFVRRRNHPDADQELRDWYLETDRLWCDDPVLAETEPGDAFAFWKARYTERWPTTPTAPALEHPRSRTVGNAAALRRFVTGGPS